MHPPPSGALRLWALAIGLLAGCHGARPPVARLEQAHGAVTVRAAGAAAATSRGVGTALFVEDVVSTGADGSATLAFAGGNKITLGPNASVVIRPVGGAAAQFGVVLLAGRVHAESAGGGPTLAIGMPYGTVIMGAKVAVLEVSFDRGLAVKVGDVTFGHGGDSRTVGSERFIDVAGLEVALTPALVAGLDLTVAAPPKVEGLDLKVAAPAAPAVVLEPLVFTLTARAHVAQVQAPGQKAWAAAPARQVPLAPGSAVRTKHGGGGTRVDFGPNGSVSLAADSEMLFADARQGAEREEASYTLARGGATVHLRRAGGRKVAHTLRVAGATVAVAPTVREADVETITQAQGHRAELFVRFGQVVVNDGEVIEAGTTVSIEDGKVVGTRLLAADKVDLRVHGNAIVYFDKRPPPLNLSWSESPTADPTTVQLAQDRDFKDLVAAEALRRGSFVVDQLPAGKYFWRINDDPNTRSAVQFAQETRADCASCQRSNAIEDTGEKTVVYYQQSLPAIVLRWKAVEAAHSYVVKIFADGEFDRPLFEAAGEPTEQSFAEGKFKEGKYFWLVTALDDQKREIQAGRMNSLQIAYDNAITQLVIRAPKAHAQVSGPRCSATGEVEAGSRLFINGRRADVDEQGRFDETVALHPGHNQVIFRTAGADGVDRFYMRDVVRR